MKKLLLLLFVGMFLVSLVNASISDLGTFQKDREVSLIQTCSNCTYNNITYITKPDSSKILINAEMEKDGTFYNYTLNRVFTDQIGIYTVNGFGDPNGVQDTWNYNFEVTPSGYIDSVGFYFLILLLSAGVIFFGFWIQDGWITILGTFGLYFLGIRILFYGIVGIKEAITTNSLALIILGVAMYISVKSAIEMMNS